MKEVVRVGVMQLNIESDIFDTEVRLKNVEKAVKQISDLAEKEKNLDLVIIPEEFYAGAGYSPISLPDPLDKVKEKVFKKLGETAKKYSLYIIGGLTTKVNPMEFKGNNISFVIDRTGEFIGYQERFHQNVTESPYSFTGTEYKLFDLDFGKIGIALGVDILFPEVARNFAMKGCEIIVNPTLFPNSSDNTIESFPGNVYLTCAAARAFENQVFVILNNGVGDFAHADLKLAGNSVVAGPKGIVYRAGMDEECRVVELDSKDKTYVQDKIPIWQMRNQDICQVK
jgi:predicted amidohydrolase